LDLTSPRLKRHSASDNNWTQRGFKDDLRRERLTGGANFESIVVKETITLVAVIVTRSFKVFASIPVKKIGQVYENTSSVEDLDAVSKDTLRNGSTLESPLA
jgi:hypothetical protein